MYSSDKGMSVLISVGKVLYNKSGILISRMHHKYKLKTLKEKPD